MRELIPTPDPASGRYSDRVEETVKINKHNQSVKVLTVNYFRKVQYEGFREYRKLQDILITLKKR